MVYLRKCPMYIWGECVNFSMVNSTFTYASSLISSHLFGKTVVLHISSFSGTFLTKFKEKKNIPNHQNKKTSHHQKKEPFLDPLQSPHAKICLCVSHCFATALKYKVTGFYEIWIRILLNNKKKSLSQNLLRPIFLSLFIQQTLLEKKCDLEYLKKFSSGCHLLKIKTQNQQDKIKMIWTTANKTSMQRHVYTSEMWVCQYHGSVPPVDLSTCSLQHGYFWTQLL